MIARLLILVLAAVGVVAGLIAIHAPIVQAIPGQAAAAASLAQASHHLSRPVKTLIGEEHVIARHIAADWPLHRVRTSDSQTYKSAGALPRRAPRPISPQLLRIYNAMPERRLVRVLERQTDEGIGNTLVRMDPVRAGSVLSDLPSGRADHVIAILASFKNRSLTDQTSSPRAARRAHLLESVQ